MQLKGDSKKEAQENDTSSVAKSKTSVNDCTCLTELDNGSSSSTLTKRDNEANIPSETCKVLSKNGSFSDEENITQLVLKTNNLSIRVDTNGHSNCNKDTSIDSSPEASGHVDIKITNGAVIVLNGYKINSNEAGLLDEGGETEKSQVCKAFVQQLTCDTSFMTQTPDIHLAASPESEGTISSISESSANGCDDLMLNSPGAEGLALNHSVNEYFENQSMYDEHLDDECTVYEFEIPQLLCGLLIGKNGRFVKHLKLESNVEVKIHSHHYLPNMKTCMVTGTPDEISKALKCIRERFPIDKYPQMTLSPLNQSEPTLPVTVKLPLPADVTFDVILSSVVDPGHFFVHQPTHPTYHTLSYLSNCMSSVYSSDDAPKLLRYNVGFIVSAPLGGGWYRTEIMHIDEEFSTCVLKILDFGGFAAVPLDCLRQLRYDFAVFPFQASECFLANITYLEEEDGWSEEAKNAFIELSQGIIQGVVVGYDEHSIPYVNLYRAQGASSLFINQELVNLGLARWVGGQPVSR